MNSPRQRSAFPVQLGSGRHKTRQLQEGNDLCSVRVICDDVEEVRLGVACGRQLEKKTRNPGQGSRTERMH